MEADWSVEIGADLPVIAVPWDGFVDLRRNPAADVDYIGEAVAHPALARALETLNAMTSPAFTSKCDCWVAPADEIDPFEFDATRDEAQQGIACYIDIIARNPDLVASFIAHETWVRTAALALRMVALQRARADFVVRRALVNQRDGFAITLYAAACGESEAAAYITLESALNHAITATIQAATRASSSIG